MAIITISRGCSNCGKEIAESVAEMLGHQCVSRNILIQTSRFFGVSETKLRKSLHDAPTILDRITRAREGYLSYVQAALKGICEAEVMTDRGRGACKSPGTEAQGNRFCQRPRSERSSRTDQGRFIRGSCREAVLKIPGLKELVCVVDLPYYS